MRNIVLGALTVVAVAVVAVILVMVLEIVLPINAASVPRDCRTSVECENLFISGY